MQIHELKPKTKNKTKKRIGRGGKRGTYSGKGMKGQKSRAGAKMAPIARELIKRYPKLRGYNFSPLKKDFTINISLIDKFFTENEVVTPQVLAKKGLIGKSKKLPIKILGNGNISKKIIIRNCSVSAKAKEIIENAGGKVILKELEVSKNKKSDKINTKKK